MLTDIAGNAGSFEASIKASLGTYSSDNVKFKINIIAMTITPPTIPTQIYNINSVMTPYNMPDFTITKNPDIAIAGLTWTYSLMYQGQTHPARDFLGYA